MLGSLFILHSISGILLDVFNCVFLFIEPQQCKFYASVMKSNLLNVQRLSLSSFMVSQCAEAFTIKFYGQT